MESSGPTRCLVESRHADGAAVADVASRRNESLHGCLLSFAGNRYGRYAAGAALESRKSVNFDASSVRERTPSFWKM
jgi:hypothetical protein